MLLRSAPSAKTARPGKIGENVAILAVAVEGRARSSLDLALVIAVATVAGLVIAVAMAPGEPDAFKRAAKYVFTA